ncbi:MAG: VWA domain-containing protein, partial [Deltaproteobacteria bacterium]|nr:VWA domain-containing protein [Deltaproteobacteria bacterium]
MLRRSSIVRLSFVLSLAACGGEGVAEDVDATLSTLEPVRGNVQLGERPAPPVARTSRNQKITTGGASIARLVLDSGPRLLVGADARVSVAGVDAVAVEAGRVYADVIAGDRLRVEAPGGALSTADGALSVEVRGTQVVVYVVRGEVAWATGNGRGAAHAGEEVTLAGGRATTRPAVLWADWTGGLARPGPQGAAQPEGMGTLEARVPDEIGLARWPLVIRRLDVRVSVHDDLAITEVDQVFFNPASDTVEGLYRVRVPIGAVLSQFAVDRDGRLVQGYVREKAQARAAYEAQVYRGSTDDPALLEWVAPGSYKAQIYPIPPGATRRIVIRYAEWLSRPSAQTPRLYRYPMGTGASAPHVQEFSLAVDLEEAGAQRVRAGMGATVEANQVLLRRSDFRPRSDFLLELVDGGATANRLRAYQSPYERPRRAPGSRTITNEADERDFFYLPVVLPQSLAAARERGGIDVVVVADVSAATDRSHLELGRSVIESVASHLGGEDRIAVVTSDVTIRALSPEQRPALGPASTTRIDALLDTLARTAAGGATDLGQAIGDAAALLDGTRPGVVLYVGDGAPTVGELGAAGLLERLARLPAPVRLYAVAVGADANLDLLEALSAGGGLATRVEERADAADAVLRILAHASRPIAQRVTVELGSGIDGVYPRRAVDVVLGEPLEVVGRVRGDVPRAVVVRGTIAGRAFAQRFDLETRRSPVAAGDLRLRWANERLRHLLLDGAGREAVAELGTRYGLITPFTSYYVPSARELREMGESASLLWLDAPGGNPPEREPLGVGPRAPWASAFAFLAIGGCSLVSSDQEAPAVMVSAPGARSEEGTMGRADQPNRYGIQGPSDNPDPQMAREQARAAATAAGALGVIGSTTPTTTAAAPSPPAEPSPEPSAPAAAAPSGQPVAANDPAPALGGMMGDQIGENFGQGGLGLRGAGRGGGGVGQGTIGLGNIGNVGHGGGSGSGSGYGSGGGRLTSRRAPTESAARPMRAPPSTREAQQQERRRIDGTPGFFGGESDDESSNARVRDRSGSNVDIAIIDAEQSEDGDDDGRDTTVTVRVTRRPRTRCSDAARLPLEDRRALWRERLGQTSGSYAWVNAYRRAIRECEAPGWRDRRAMLDLILEQAGAVGTMVDVYRQLSGSAAGSYLRSAILRRIRSPSDLRLARDAFGLGAEPDWPTVERLLREAADDSARIRLVRQLVRDYPSNMQLRLRLLALLEQARRLPEARRLADTLRADPMADATVRTAIGEMYLR